MSLPDQTQFLSKFHIDPDRFSACGLKWDDLITIANDHVRNHSVLLAVANYINDRLRTLQDVHSLRLRIKDPEHLIEKIIRKNLQSQKAITVDNYKVEITDLVGIRALHLFKDQWKPIHDFVVQSWHTHETPTAYLRQGDSPKLVELLEKSGCEVKNHDFGYRSVHYLLSVQPEKQVHIVELQVRTVFEEGWSEIDHRVRYPNQSQDERLEDFLVIFNRLAGSADEMGLFIKNLSLSIRKESDLAEQMRNQLADKEKELQQVVSKLNISEKEKANLQHRIEELKSKQLLAPSFFPSEFSESLRTYASSPSIAEFSDGLKAYRSSLSAVETKVCPMCGYSARVNILHGPNTCPRCRSNLV